MQRFGVLPEAGGLLDQSAKRMSTYREALNAYNAFLAYEQGGKKAGERGKWRAANEGAWNVVKRVEALREQQQAKQGE